MSDFIIFAVVFLATIISRNLILKAMRSFAKVSCLTIMLLAKTIEFSTEIEYDRDRGIFRCL